jgi:hypothetical protein
LKGWGNDPATYLAESGRAAAHWLDGDWIELILMQAMMGGETGKTQSMWKSKGVVLKITIYKGKFLVTFPKYAAYFQTDDPILQEKIRKVHAEQREVSITFDPKFKILSVD